VISPVRYSVLEVIALATATRGVPLVSAVVQVARPSGSGARLNRSAYTCRMYRWTAVSGATLAAATDVDATGIIAGPLRVAAMPIGAVIRLRPPRANATHIDRYRRRPCTRRPGTT